MKYCLSSKCSKKNLLEVDQIKYSGDIRNLYVLIEQYPNTTFIIQNVEEEFKKYKELYILSKGRIILEINNMYYHSLCKAYDLPFYFTYQVGSLYELEAIKKYNPKYIYLAAPLFFSMDLVKANCDIPVRVIANDPHQDLFQRDDYVNGRWIRPEDVEAYEEYIDTIEFTAETGVKEDTLYKIYAHDNQWPGDLGMIISDLNYIGVNGMIHPIAIRKRLNCGQRCMEGKCRICYRALNMADGDKYEEYISLLD